MWRNWHRKGLLLAAGFLALAFVGGVASHTAYAKFKGNELKVREFHTSFGGVTVPFSELENGPFDVELFGDRFIRNRDSQMTITLVKMGNMVSMTDQTVCDDGSTKGWCISSRKDSWAFHPQTLNSVIPVDNNTTILWGPGMLEQLEGNESGMANFKVKIDVPANPEEGVQVVVDLEGFASRMKEHRGDHDREDREEDEEGEDED